MMYRIAILRSHPIQYSVPFYRRLAQHPQIDLKVFFCSRMGLNSYIDPGFNQAITWDIPLLDGYRHDFLPNWQHESSKKRNFLSLINPAIISELRRERFDALVVYGHAYATNWLAMMAAKYFDIPIMMRTDSTLVKLKHHQGLRKKFRQIIISKLYRLCSAFLVSSSANADYYRAHGVSDHQLFLVPHAVDNQHFFAGSFQGKEDKLAKKKELGISSSAPIILYVAKLSKQKRPLDLLQACKKLSDERIETSILFVGSGPQERELKEYVEKSQLDNVCFAGFRNQSELPQLYGIADVFVLPAENEAFGLVINEAMCAGLPIITTSEVGAAADLVKQGHNGFVYSVGDINVLAQCLKQLLIDSNLRQQMGIHSRELIDGWDYEAGITGFLNALAFIAK